MFGRERKTRFSKRKSREVSQYTQGMLRYRRGDYRAAAKMLADLSDRDGPLGRMAVYYGAMANRALGIEAMRTSDFAQAERYLTAAARAIGNKANLTSYLAACYARNQRFDRCAAEMAKAAESNGGPAEWRKLAQAQWRDGQKDQALMSLHKALRMFGNDSRVRMQLGLFHASEERFDEAFEHLSDAVLSDCDNPMAHYYLGLTAAATGDIAQTMRCLQRAFDLAPDNLLIARQLSLAAQAADQKGIHFILRLPGQFTEQESSHARQLARYIAQDSDLPDVMLCLPESEIDNDLFGVLANVLDIALSDHGRYADLHYHASRVHQRLGHNRRAADHVRRALRINPKYVKARMQLAELCKRPDRAARHMTKAIEDGADWPDAHFRAAELLARCRQTEAARKHLLRALELKPDYTRARQTLELLAA